MHRPNRLAALAFCLTMSPAIARAALGDCGQPQTTGETPKSSDALVVLKTAVGTGSCPKCVCDVNRNGTTTAGDALAVLRLAVGQVVTLECADCLASMTIGAAGGTLVSHNGRVEIVVPPGAVDGPTQFTIIGDSRLSLPDSFDGFDIFDTYQLGPEGLVFDPSLEVIYHLPDGTFTPVAGGVTFLYPQLMTAAGDDPESLDNVEAVFDVEAGTAEVHGQLSHFSPLVSLNGVGEPFTITAAGFPEIGEVPNVYQGTMSVSSEALEVPKPTEAALCTLKAFGPLETLACASTCGLKPAEPTSNWVKDGDAWTIPLSATCQAASTCPVKYEAVVAKQAGPTEFIITLALEAKFNCAAAAGPKKIAVARMEIEDLFWFRRPFASIPPPPPPPELGWNALSFSGPSAGLSATDVIIGLGTADGSTAFSLDTEAVEFDRDDGVSTGFGHYGGFPLRSCNGPCKEAWVQYGPATGGIAVWNYDDKAQSFGDPDITGGPFNGFDDAYPVDIPEDGIAASAYAANISAATVLKIAFDNGEGKFVVSGPIVQNGWGPGQNPSTLFPFPNGSMVIVGTGNATTIQGKLYFHPGNNPATAVTPIGDVGLYPRRIRCAVCNGSSIYTCVNSALSGSQLFVSQINPANGAGSVTDHQATGQGPNGVAVIAKLSHPGCFAVVTNFGGGGYTLCDIDNDGKAACEQMALPEECPDPRFVAALPDGSFLVSCQNSELLVQLARPAEE